jgi:DNA topoisomerase-1
MPLNLMIVESPGKVKKLQGFLGAGWKVAASVGHVLDLPERELGVTLPEFKPLYQPTERGAEVLKKLAAVVNTADNVFLATDPDREGEAIAWHLRDALKLKNAQRVTFTSITENAVKAALKTPRKLDMDLIRAQTARRILDRLCGFLVSGPLSKAARQRLSAGRVQSPALRLVVERERAIAAFVPVRHFSAELTFDGGWKAAFNIKPWLPAGESYLTDFALATAAAAIRELVVAKCEEKETKVAPPAPFTTSSLQQAASNALKFNPQKTMELAQKLYEVGHITYMRTDCPNIAPEALVEIRRYCERYKLPLSPQPRVWKAKGSSQEAHEAIRPTHIENEVAGETPDEAELYRLIRMRTLASQLADAEYAVRTASLHAPLHDKTAEFIATGRTLVKPGWKSILENDAAVDDEDDKAPANPVPQLRAGTGIKAGDGQVLKKTTRAPERYTEAALVRELEKRDIGRPSTYAAIMATIMRRGYVQIEKRKLKPTPLGETAVDFLSGAFGFADYGFTREMEAYLDDLAEGKAVYREVLDKAYRRLLDELTAFSVSHPAAQTGRAPDATAFICTECGKPLVHMRGRKKDGTGDYDFFACSDRGCGASYPNVDGKPGAVKKRPEQTKFLCANCGKPLVHMCGQRRDGTGDYDFFACPDKACNATYPNDGGVPGEPKSKPEKTKFKCKVCGKPLFLRAGKKGKFFGCSGYPECKEIYWEKDGKPQKPRKKQ